jgi:hypothetical protein
VIGCDGTRETRPTTIVIACGDGNIQAIKLHWKSWTRASGLASGEIGINSCVPDCADGVFHYYDARITADSTTIDHGVNAFMRLRAEFVHVGPNGKTTESFHLPK